MSEEKYQAEARHFGHAPQDAPVEDTAADEAEAAIPSSRLKQTMRRQARNPGGVKIRLRDDKPRLRLRSPKQRLKYTQAESTAASLPVNGENTIRPKGAANIQPENKNRATNLKTAQRRHRQLKITQQQKSSRPSNMVGEVRQEPQSAVAEYREPARQSLRFGNSTDRFTAKDVYSVNEGMAEQHTRLRFTEQSRLQFKGKPQATDTSATSLVAPVKRRLRLQQSAQLRFAAEQRQTHSKDMPQKRLRFTEQSRLQFTDKPKFHHTTVGPTKRPLRLQQSARLRFAAEQRRTHSKDMPRQRVRFTDQIRLQFTDKPQPLHTSVSKTTIGPTKRRLRLQQNSRLCLSIGHLETDGSNVPQQRLRFTEQSRLKFADKTQSLDTAAAKMTAAPVKHLLRRQRAIRLRYTVEQRRADVRNSQQQRLRFTEQSRFQPDGAALSAEVPSGYKKQRLRFSRPDRQIYGDASGHRHRLKLPSQTMPDQQSGSQSVPPMAVAQPRRWKPRLRLVRPTSQLESSERKLKDIQPSKSWKLQYQYEELRFRADSEHWRFGDKQSQRTFRFSDSGKKPPSRLKFEEDRAPHASRLRFEEDRTAPKGGKAVERQTKGWTSGFNATKQETERAVNELADQSENEGIQSANQHRKWQTTGLGEGWRAGGAWRQGHDQRVVQREIKRATREAKDKAYELRHGKPSRSAEIRKKLMIRKRQMENFAEKKAGKKAVQNTERFIAFIAEKAAQLIRLAVAYIAGPAIGVIAIYAAVAVLVLIMFSAFMDSATAVITSYAAPDTEIEAASSYYSKLEAELDKEIKNISTAWEWQHIDQFHYDLDDIEHDPFQLMGYLSVKYPGFTFSDVKTELDYIFDQRYTLTTHQWYEWEGEGPERFKYYHLDVTLRAKPMEPILLNELAKDTENDLVSWYGVLMETKGAHQAYANPFDIDWSGNVSSLYGYRVDPIGEKELQQHRGLDIAMATGTPIRAGVSGTVRYVGHDNIMGNYIILDADGVEHTMKYGHCDEVRVSAGEKVVAGETVIGTVGNSGQSTGPHLHVEILEKGEYVNPIYSLNYKEKAA